VSRDELGRFLNRVNGLLKEDHLAVPMYHFTIGIAGHIDAIQVARRFLARHDNTSFSQKKRDGMDTKQIILLAHTFPLHPVVGRPCSFLVPGR